MCLEGIILPPIFHFSLFTSHSSLFSLPSFLPFFPETSCEDNEYRENLKTTNQHQSRTNEFRHWRKDCPRMFWSVVAHAWTHIRKRRHGNTQCLVVIELLTRTGWRNAMKCQEERTQQQGSHKQGNESKQGLYHLVRNDLSIDTYRKNGSWMENLTEILRATLKMIDQRIHLNPPVELPEQAPANLTNSSGGMS